jgi:hypothetical protein
MFRTDRGIHMQTHRLMAGMLEAFSSDESRCSFVKIGLGIRRGGGPEEFTDTQEHRSTEITNIAQVSFGEAEYKLYVTMESLYK